MLYRRRNAIVSLVVDTKNRAEVIKFSSAKQERWRSRAANIPVC